MYPPYRLHFLIVVIGSPRGFESWQGCRKYATPMSGRFTSVPVLELAAAAPFDHVEAVTVVLEVVRRVVQDELPGVPSAHVIRLLPSGSLVVEGPIAADGSAVRRAAHLLETLLPPVGAHVRVPGALRIAVARALGTLDLPPYPSLESFADALSRFAAVEPGECLRQILANRPEPREAAALEAEAPEVVTTEVVTAMYESTITVSDIRRARRATGVPLSEISRRCHVPTALLRQLEWGYLKNWPASHIGRRLLASYARAAGLDEELVMRAVWPLLVESVESRSREELPAPIVVDVQAESLLPALVASRSLARIEPVVRRRWDAHRIVAALAIPALLAIGAAPAMWEQHAAARRDAAARTAPVRTAQAPAVQPAARPVQPAAAVQPAAPPVQPAAQPPVRLSEVSIAVPSVSGNAATRVNVRPAVYASSQPSSAKSRRPAATKSAKARQERRAVSRSKGPRKWGIWVLNKVGVRIVNTDQQ